MTLSEFFGALKKLNLRWALGTSGCVRIASPTNHPASEFQGNCPIQAVAGRFKNFSNNNMSAFDDARYLGLNAKDARRIMNAADGNKRIKIRPDLLRACKLKEVKEV